MKLVDVRQLMFLLFLTGNIPRDMPLLSYAGSRKLDVLNNDTAAQITCPGVAKAVQ